MRIRRHFSDSWYAEGSIRIRQCCWEHRQNFLPFLSRVRHRFNQVIWLNLIHFRTALLVSSSSPTQQSHSIESMIKKPIVHRQKLPSASIVCSQWFFRLRKSSVKNSIAAYSFVSSSCPIFEVEIRIPSSSRVSPLFYKLSISHGVFDCC